MPEVRFPILRQRMITFPYQWRIADGYPAKGVQHHKSKVFSMFACGGGSTMGYKLAGYDVIGVNEIDPVMMQVYTQNHHPKHPFLEDIRTFNQRKDIPSPMYKLDVLDGSPPCSSFSMAGSREKDWGKKKKFREGQAEQTLDDLFFDFINTARLLHPKVVIAENVSGMLKGNARGYVVKIVETFNAIGYDVQVFNLNAASMGVPQRRQRVFFLCRRQDLKLPPIKLQFNEKPIKFGAVRTPKGTTKQLSKLSIELLQQRLPTDKHIGDINMRLFGKVSRFNAPIIRDMEVCPTIVSSEVMYRSKDGMVLSDEDLIHCGSFPEDFDFTGSTPKYVIGMSVPPVMMANVAHEVYKQWLLPTK